MSRIYGLQADGATDHYLDLKVLSSSYLHLNYMVCCLVIAIYLIRLMSIPP